MRMVPVTRRKMIKMLMILSRDRSSHTIIYTEEEEMGDNREEGGVRGQVQKHFQWSDSWRNLCPSDVMKPFWISGPAHSKVMDWVDQQPQCHMHATRKNMYVKKAAWLFCQLRFNLSHQLRFLDAPSACNCINSQCTFALLSICMCANITWATC